jgi:methylenetetrahydrofolate dehydrogenase (NADP+)/methenyltetrahydrofolate cyclohydrolase
MILDGKALAERIKHDLRPRVAAWKQEHPTPRLAVLRVGQDPASEVYVRNKAAAALAVGIDAELVHRRDATQAEVLALIEQWNDDRAVHAILVQLPLPAGIETQAVLDAIDARKDVDGFAAEHAGRLAQGRDCIVPCTPRGVMRLLAEVQQDLSGLHAVVVGRSNIVGKPVGQLLLHANATVTMCHSRTRDLPGMVRQADVLVAAIGRPELVRGAWIKPGAIVIDVGINRGADGRLVGDVEFAAARERARAITPVPGGVGPMTIAMLLENTLECARRLAAGAG